MNSVKKSFSSKAKSWILNGLKIVFAVFIIYWLVSSGKIDFKNIKYILSPVILCGLLGILGFNLFLTSERWRFLLRGQGFQLKFYDAFKYTVVGTFFNFAVPGGVGGDVVKAYYIAKHNPERKLKAVMTILIDRLVGLYFMVFMALAAMLVAYAKVVQDAKLLLIFYVISGVFVVFTLAWILVLSHLIFDSRFILRILQALKIQKLIQLYDAITEYRHHKILLFQCFILSALAQTISVFFFCLVGYALGEGAIGLDTYFFAVPVGFIITAIPISPAGVGVGQAAFYYLFATYSKVDNQVGALGITVFQMGSFLYGILGVYYYLQMGKVVDSVEASGVKK